MAKRNVNTASRDELLGTGLRAHDHRVTVLVLPVSGPLHDGPRKGREAATFDQADMISR